MFAELETVTPGKSPTALRAEKSKRFFDEMLVWITNNVRGTEVAINAFNCF